MGPAPRNFWPNRAVVDNDPQAMGLLDRARAVFPGM